jgi:hypothetical protein
MWASGRNTRNASATPSGIKRECYECIIEDCEGQKVNKIVCEEMGVTVGLRYMMGQEKT